MQEWQEEYIKSLKQKDQNTEAKIKEKYMPKKLYKFVPCKEKTSFDNLFNSKIYLSSPKNFNDPYDSKPLFNPTEVQKTKTQIPVIKIQKILLDFMNNYRIACFTQNDYTDILMWSHYADSHKGFCLEFAPEKELFNNYFAFIHPVIYSSKIYDLTTTLCTFFKTNHANEMDFIISSLYKAIQWEYENEWRIILPLQDKKEVKFIDIDKPTAIYLGLNIKNTCQQALVKFAEDENIPIFKMQRFDDEYKLYKKEIILKQNKEVQACEVL